VEHLGYVQIDTINVIERSHHHILYSRIPDYRRAHLQQAQSVDKAVFEYWTHALSYVPTRDIQFFLGEMKRYRKDPGRWFATVNKQDLRKVLSLIRKGGPLTIRDIDDDVLVDKVHPWASRKPSKRALQLGFYTGILAISARSGMLKTYELMERHFGWDKRPKPASEREVLDYLLERALRAQGLISLDSVCHLDAGRKSAIRRLIEARIRRKELVPITFDGAVKVAHWARPEALEAVQLLFDPLLERAARAAADPGPLLQQELALLAVGLEIDGGDDRVVDQNRQGEVAEAALLLRQIGLEAVLVVEEQLCPLALNHQRIERRQNVHDPGIDAGAIGKRVSARRLDSSLTIRPASAALPLLRPRSDFPQNSAAHRRR